MVVFLLFCVLPGGQSSSHRAVINFCGLLFPREVQLGGYQLRREGVLEWRGLACFVLCQQRGEGSGLLALAVAAEKLGVSLLFPAATIPNSCPGEAPPLLFGYLVLCEWGCQGRVRCELVPPHKGQTTCYDLLSCGCVGGRCVRG